MEKPNKIYIAYVKPPFKNDILYHDIIDRLELEEKTYYPKYFYGWTPDKKLMKEFMKYRDPDRFIIKKKDISYIPDDIFEKLKPKLYETEIQKPEEIDTISCRVKNSGNPENGIVSFKFSLVRFERDTIYNTMEWFDDHIAEDFTDESLAVLSIVVKCATPELKKAMYNSGLLSVLLYVDMIHMGNMDGFDEFIPMLDEVYILLDFYGELFKF